jgi:hypothetical protein
MIFSKKILYENLFKIEMLNSGCCIASFFRQYRSLSSFGFSFTVSYHGQQSFFFRLYSLNLVPPLIVPLPWSSPVLCPHQNLVCLEGRFKLLDSCNLGESTCKVCSESIVKCYIKMLGTIGIFEENNWLGLGSQGIWLLQPTSGVDI